MNNNSILNNNFIFDETISSIRTNSYDNMTGVIMISENGLYMFDLCIDMQSTSGSPSIIFKLISDKGYEFDSNSPTKTGSMSGIVVF